jgi:hypothetical protein
VTYAIEALEKHRAMARDAHEELYYRLTQDRLAEFAGLVIEEQTWRDGRVSRVVAGHVPDVHGAAV